MYCEIYSFMYSWRKLSFNFARMKLFVANYTRKVWGWIVYT